MSNTIINVKVIDQKIQLTNTPLIASGSQGALQVHCAFDSLWAGYEVTAVFYRDKKEVYHVPVYLSTATIPWEVLATDGHFFMGFFGVAENTRTTEVIRLEVKQGAITEGIAVPDPTPDVYTQLMEILHQSGVIPDATLTQAGKAADAKAVGDAIQGVIDDTTTMMGETVDDLMALYPKESDTYPGCYYRTVGEEVEWVNPPMMLETEYRTTERYLGKAVYTKLLDFGVLPGNNNLTWKAFDVAATNFLRVEGKSDWTCFPRIGTFGGTVGVNKSLAGIGVYVAQDTAPGKVAICVYSDMASTTQTAYIQLWYTKD